MVESLHRGFGDSSNIRRLAVPLPLILDLLNPSSIDLRQTVEDYYCTKFQVISIRGFRFIVLSYTPTSPRTHTHTYTHRDKVIAISAPPYEVVGGMV